LNCLEELPETLFTKRDAKGMFEFFHPGFICCFNMLSEHLVAAAARLIDVAVTPQRERESCFTEHRVSAEHLPFRASETNSWEWN